MENLNIKEMKINQYIYELYLCFLSSSLESYKKETLLSPIPKIFIKEKKEDFILFKEKFNEFPNYKKIFKKEKEGNFIHFNY
jgi:hypothetical protein